LYKTGSGRRHLPEVEAASRQAVLWLVSGFAARRFAAERLVVSRHAARRDTGFASGVISFRL